MIVGLRCDAMPPEDLLHLSPFGRGLLQDPDDLLLAVALGRHSLSPLPIRLAGSGHADWTSFRGAGPSLCKTPRTLRMASGVPSRAAWSGRLAMSMTKIFPCVGIAQTWRIACCD